MAKFFWQREERTAVKQLTETIAKLKIDGGFSAPANLASVFKGENESFNLASGSVSKQISTAARLCGVPVIINEGYEWLQDLITNEGQTLVTYALVNGTHWALPKLKGSEIIIEHILDSSIGNNRLRVDLDTGELEAVYEETQIQRPVGEIRSTLETKERYRSWTKERVREQLGDVVVKDEPNLLGIMPVPFVFGDTETIRGISAYAGQLRLIRAIHELRLNRDGILARAKPKFKIQSDDPAEFVNRNRGVNDQTTYDPYKADVVVCLQNEQATWEEYPAGFFTAINEAIEDNQKELLTSGLLPEMFSGRALVGNYASAEYNVIQGVEFINSLRRAFTKPWRELLNSIAKLHAYEAGGPAVEIELGWNAFDMMTATNKAQVLVGIVQAVQVCVASGMPVELVYDMVKQLNPALDYKTADEMQEAIYRTKQETPFDEEVELWK